MTSHDPDVIVIGAGLAGLSAGVRLAKAGAKVIVVEQAPRLGGRASAFTDKVTGDRVDNGQHVLFGCYRETTAMLRLIGADHYVSFDRTLSIAMADRAGRRFELLCPPWPAPFHLVAGLAGWQPLSMRERWSLLRLLPLLRDARDRGPAAVAASVSADLTVSQWLEDLGQTPTMCDWLWKPLALAALNQSPDIASARMFARVLAELAGGRADEFALGVPVVPLDEAMAEPAARFIESHGGRVLRAVQARLSGSAVETGEHRWTPRATVAAVPWHALAQLWRHGVPAEMAATVDAARSMSGEPIVSVNLWFDRPVLSVRQLGLVGTHFQWVFNRPQNEVGGHFRERRSGNDLRPHFGGSVTMVASAARNLVRLGNEELTAIAEDELGECVPRSRWAQRIHAVVVREPRATFSVAPGAPARPDTRTPLPGLFLAGDWIDTGLPGTIESAVLSGQCAAAAVLESIR